MTPPRIDQNGLPSANGFENRCVVPPALAVSWICGSRAAIADDALAVADYAAILLDLGLPDEDGLGLLSRLRARGDHRPVIILTARNDNLIDNAVAHTPERTAIVLGVDGEGRIYVDDDGPGIPRGRGGAVDEAPLAFRKQSQQGG